MAASLTAPQLDALRRVGDPCFEGYVEGRPLAGEAQKKWVELVRKLVASQGPSGPLLTGWLQERPPDVSEGTLRDDWMHLSQLEFRLNIDRDMGEKIKLAQRLFATYGR